MVKFVRSVFATLMIKLFPEMSVLKSGDLNTNFFQSHIVDSKIDSLSKLYKPHRISETEIGRYTYISQNSTISKTIIGSFCSIGPNFFCGWGIHPTDGISTNPMFYSTQKQNGYTLTNIDKIEERKPINIGNDVFIGANVTVLDGVTIGDGVVIGAGAVVSKDIPSYAIAAGSPIQIIRYRFTPEIIEAMLKLKWWNWEPDKLKEVEKYFNDVDGFIRKYS